MPGSSESADCASSTRSSSAVTTERADESSRSNFTPSGAGAFDATSGAMTSRESSPATEFRANRRSPRGASARRASPTPIKRTAASDPNRSAFRDHHDLVAAGGLKAAAESGR